MRIIADRRGAGRGRYAASWERVGRAVLVCLGLLGVGLQTGASQNRPVITSQPRSLTVVQGDSASFTVGVTGDPPLVYQWRRNGGLIFGATNVGYTLLNVQPSDAAAFNVIVFNNSGAVTSQVASLTVGELPAILSQPTSQSVVRGGSVSLEVATAGPSPVSYQWLRNGVEVPGATDSGLTLSNVQPAQGGSYRVRVTNPFGSVLSESASITVLQLDFGDAPSPTFPTALAQDGARHVIRAGFHLGASVDHESDGQGHPMALGDDENGIDDEDGVLVLSPPLIGQVATFAVVASAEGLLNVWIDFNRNGTWADAGEHAVTNRILLAGTNVVGVTVPGSAAAGLAMSRFRFTSTPDPGVTGLALDGEVEDYAFNLLRSVDLSVSQDDDISVVGLNSNVTFSIIVTNQGLTLAEDVVLENFMPDGMTLVNASTSQGSCTLDGAVIRCSLGSLPPGGRVNLAMRLQAGSIGTKINRVTVSSTGLEATPGNNVADEETLVVFFSPFRINPQQMSIPELAGGPANIYPSTIFVSGVTATVFKVVVSLQNISHTFPDDLDVVLVGPNGIGVMLMSDTCGDLPLSNVTFTFDDDATQGLPDSVLETPVPSGLYRPTNFGFIDILAPPAPPGPYASTLGFFEGIDPNGTWSLYVFDDAAEDGGTMGGWSLRLILLDPIADLGVAAAAPSPVLVGSNLTYHITVTNRGPSVATDVVVEDLFPAGTLFVSAQASQGGCQFVEGFLTCELGGLAVGATATVTVEARTTVPGEWFHQLAVTSADADLNGANDLALLLTSVRLPADLGVTMAGSPEPGLQGQPITYSITVTNRGPNAAQTVSLANTLAEGVELISTVASQGACAEVGGIIQCNLGPVAPGGNARVTILARPTTSGQVTNQAVVTLGPELDAVLTNNMARLVSTVLPAADLSVRALGSSGSVLVGEVLTCTLVVSNAGPAAATAVVLSNQVPAHVELISLTSSSGSCEVIDQLIVCDWESLNPGETGVVTLEVRPTLDGPMESVARVAGAQPDPTVTDQEARLLIQVLPVIDLVVEMFDFLKPVLLPNSVMYSITVSNLGPSTAASVVLTNLLPAGAELMGWTASQGGCGSAGGVVRCELGQLSPGSGALITLQVRPSDSGVITNRVEASSVESEATSLNNSAVVTTLVLVELGVFAGPDPILLPSFGSGEPYPATIEVAGVTLPVEAVLVTLHNLTHSFSDDLDFLLEGPLGQTVVLMSDAGGAQELQGVTLTFADDADNLLPDNAGIVDGIFRPTNHGDLEDEFPAPAPAPAQPHGGELSVFRELDPNGTWSLYVVDDAEKDGGLLAGGWSVRFATAVPIADLGVAAGGPPAVAPMSNMVYTVAVTNRGPSAAGGVVVSNVLPAGFILFDVTVTQGACAVGEGRVECELGRVASGVGVVVTIAGQLSMLGSHTNHATVMGLDFDPNSSDNASEVVTTVEEPVFIVDQPESVVAAAGQPVTLAISTDGTGPFFYQWFKDGQPIAGENGPLFSRSAVTFFDQGTYTIQVTNRVSEAVSAPAELMVLSPPVITQPPQSVTNLAGSNRRLEVTAVGSGELSYQWFFQSQPLPQATDRVLSLQALTTAMSGSYSVVVSNQFGLTTSPVVELTVREADFGDAPRPGYPTTLADGGAFHFLAPGMYLGAGVDYEPDGQPHAMALGDDLSSTDDEDGIRFLDALLVGSLARVEVVASTSGRINAWLDFNGNLSWAQPGEQIFTNAPVIAGTNVLTFRVVASAIAHNTFARFRFNTAGGLGPSGPALDGEVEDYQVNLVPVIDLAIRQSADRDPAPLGSALTYNIVVTNKGPSRASVVMVEDHLPSGVNLVSATASQGSCGAQSGTVICNLGSVSAAGFATVQIVVTPTVGGILNNRVTTTAPELEFNAADNTALETTIVVEPPSILQHPQGTNVLEGSTVEFSVAATGAQPLSYQWFRNGLPLANATSPLLRLTAVTPAQSGRYHVVVSNPVASVPSADAQLTVTGGALPGIEALTVNNVSSTGAVLRARVDPNRLATTAWFEWGITTDYGQLTPLQMVGSGDVFIEVTAPLTDLEAGQSYHYRVVATNLAGRVTGEGMFAWESEPLPEIIVIRALPTGNMRMFFSGAAGQRYEVEGTTNFESWDALGPGISLGNGAFQIDLFGGFPYRYFRVFAP